MMSELNVHTVQTLPIGLARAYIMYFERMQRQLGDIFLYRRALSLALLTPRTPIPETIWKRCLGFKSNTLAEKMRYQKFKEVISRLLIFSGDGTLKPPHKSMCDWLQGSDKSRNSAEEMGRLDLAVDQTKEDHLLLAGELENIFNSRTTQDWIVQTSLIEEQFAFTHTLFHWAYGGDLLRGSLWVTDCSRLFRLICQGEDGYFRAIDDIAGLLKRMSLLPKQDASIYSKVKLGRDILVLAGPAICHDPRELAEQIIGRIGIPPFDENQLHFQNEAQSWVEIARSKGNLSIALPHNSG